MFSLLEYYVRGILFGVLLTFSVQAYVVYYIYKSHLFKRTTSQSQKETAEPVNSAEGEEWPKVPHEHSEAWPQMIVEFLKKTLAVSDQDVSTTNSNPKAAPVITSQTETCEWLNIISQRFFIELRASELFKFKTMRKISERINERLRNNSILTQFNLSAIDLGHHSPSIHGVRIVKGFEEDLAVTAEFDVTYVGGANITVDLTLAGNIQISVKIYMKSLSGKLRVRCPSIKWSDMLCVSFTEDPGIAFVVDSPITVRDNQLVKDFVNNVLAKIVRKAFVETWVMPNWRNFYLPLMQPYPHQVLERATMKQPRPSRPATGHKTWDSGTFILQGKPSASSSSFLTQALKSNVQTQGDCLQDVFFDSTYIVTDETLSEYQDKLFQIFTEIAQISTHEPKLLDYTLNWRTVKNKQGISVEKSRIMLSNATFSELTRAKIVIPLEAHMVYFFLANPNHLSHIDDSFMKFKIIKQIDEISHIRLTTVQHRKGQSEVTLFDIRKKIDDTTYVIVFRSIGGYQGVNEGVPSEAVQEQKNTKEDVAIYIFGYLIQGLGDGRTSVSYITQLSSDLSRMEVSSTQARKLKTFIERLYSTHDPDDEAEKNKVKDRLKSMWSSTTTYLKGAAETSWNRYLSSSSLNQRKSGDGSAMEMNDFSFRDDDASEPESSANLSFDALQETSDIAEMHSRARSTSIDNSQNRVVLRQRSQTMPVELEKTESSLSLPSADISSGKENLDIRVDHTLMDDFVKGLDADGRVSDVPQVTAGLSDAESVTEQHNNSDQKSIAELPSSLVQEEYLNSTKEDLRDSEYTDKILQVKEVHAQPLTHSPTENKKAILFVEFSSRSDVNCTFTSYFITTHPFPGFTAFKEGQYIFFGPLLSSAYQSPVTLSYDISRFPEGRFMFFWENLGYGPKPMIYRVSTLDQGERSVRADVYVGRKANVRIPFPIYSNEQEDDSKMLKYSFATGGNEILFGIEYEAFSEDKIEPAKEKDTMSDRLSAIIANQKKKMFILPLTRHSSGKSSVTGRIPFLHGAGVYRLVFENPSSLMSRKLKITASVE